MQLFGRRIIVTALDDIPRAFRATPGVLAVNQVELDALKSGDGETFKRLLAIVQAEDSADARLLARPLPRRLQRSSPSLRLFMLGAIVAGRRPAK